MKRLGAGVLAVLVMTGACGESAEAPAPVTAAAPIIEARDDLRSVFDAAGVVGTFAMLDVANGRTTVVDSERAQRRLVPASTFKVPHALIALETGAIRDLDEVIPWNRQTLAFKDWERDMTVREAIKVSNASVFQTIARRIGPEKEKEWLDRLGYGHAEVGEHVDQFWLDGPLTISPVEQTRFLQRLADRSLPASTAAQDAVIGAVELERTEAFTLYGKTGWQFSRTPQLGWWVGWVRQADRRLHTFALNLDIEEPADAELRIPLARQLLQKLGAVPS